MVGKGSRQEHIPDRGPLCFEAASGAHADDQVRLEFMHCQVRCHGCRDSAHIVHAMQLTLSCSNMRFLLSFWYMPWPARGDAPWAAAVYCLESLAMTPLHNSHSLIGACMAEDSSKPLEMLKSPSGGSWQQMERLTIPHDMNGGAVLAAAVRHSRGWGCNALGDVLL